MVVVVILVVIAVLGLIAAAAFIVYKKKPKLFRRKKEDCELESSDIPNDTTVGKDHKVPVSLNKSDKSKFDGSSSQTGIKVNATV